MCCMRINNHCGAKRKKKVIRQERKMSAGDEGEQEPTVVETEVNWGDKGVEEG